MRTPDRTSPDPVRRAESESDSSQGRRVERAEVSDPGSVLGPRSTRASGSHSVLDVTVWDPHEAARAAANRELHPELLELAVTRLATIYVAAAAVLAVLLLVSLLAGERESGSVATFAGALGASLLLVAVSRLVKPRPALAYEAGFVYLFVLSFLLGVLRHLDGLAPSALLHELSPVALPILAFAALIPSTPRRALLACLGAAAMDPLALLLSRGHALPSLDQTLLAAATPTVAALSAYGVSRMAHRLSEGIVKAREVGSYRLVERLGTGGMAEVWRANHQMLARPAAVKLIRHEVLTEHGPLDAQRLLRLFAREARATASLSSPHTISVYDFGITREGAFYYVMELLDGIDLQTLVTRFGPQSSERVAEILVQACESLGEAHERNFVHRDVKPANLFVCRVGGDVDFVKVLDFGLVLDRHPTHEELEDEKRFVGTPSVMAPEMVRFQAPVDARADLYALGCVAYWLLAGRRVFEATTRHDMLVMHAHQKPVPPSKAADLQVDPALERIVMSCLEKNPNRRPQSARELRKSLRALSFPEPWSEERRVAWWSDNLHRALHGGVGATGADR